MAHEFSLIMFFIVSLLFPVLLFSTADSNIYVQCSQLNFISTTPYELNINSLFTSLIDSASLYNFNTFQISPQNDGIYGLFQCRGDVTLPNCKECVANAVSQLQTTCPVSMGGEIQLEGCFVKYDNTAFFGVQEKMEVCKRCGPSNGYNSDVSTRIDGVLANLVGDNGQYFRVCDSGSLLGVAQCVQDLSLSDCQDCILEASGRLRSECETSTWGEMYLEKCYILYVGQGDKGHPNNDPPSSPDIKRGKKKGKRDGIWTRLSTPWKIISGFLTVGSIIISVGGAVYTVLNRKRVKDLKKARTEDHKRVEALEKAAKEMKKYEISTNDAIGELKKEIQKLKGNKEININSVHPCHRYQPYNICVMEMEYSDPHACHCM